MITINILAQKGNLFDALLLQLLDLLKDSLDISTPFSPPHEGHDAKRAHIIAASHN